MRKGTAWRSISIADFRLCKNILHQLLLLADIQQSEQLFANLFARLRYVQNS